MLRAALIALGVATVVPGAIAQSTGVAACDDFLKNYETCINTRVPAAERDAHKSTIDLLRKAYADSAKSPQGKSTAENGCKATAEQYRTVFKIYGCAF